jgi:hypothetical protein
MRTAVYSQRNPTPQCSASFSQPFLIHQKYISSEVFSTLEKNALICYKGAMHKKQRSCDGWWGAQRPVRRGNEPKKTGARSARAAKSH